MKTIIWGIVVLMVFLLIGFGIWYLFMRNGVKPDDRDIQLTQSQQHSKQDTATSSSPRMESYYEIEKTELYTALSITVIPTKLGKESINGIEIALQNQQPPLPEPYQVIINTNITGELQKEWACETINKIMVRCNGSAPLALNESTILSLYFNQPPDLPQRINIRLKHDANIVASVEVLRRKY